MHARQKAASDRVSGERTREARAQMPHAGAVPPSPCRRRTTSPFSRRLARASKRVTGTLAGNAGAWSGQNANAGGPQDGRGGHHALRETLP